ncbi:MFS transporter [Streptomyces sp. NBC_00154]|uniref:MFS transporter n=1 Tax=Streptomyces sp. NBC_00154 TaxID=2975670 RepID=UPI002250D2CF|nr:MFS transporter [Streptomyces sp. NBC_00154]MCX5314589.1 MFS transporter [Streptomyces sp. NBC_00154]
MNTRTASPCARETTNAVRSTHLVFALLGLAGATWVSRLPQIQERMNLDAASVGLLLLLLAVGGLVALPLAGPFVARIGPRRAVTAVAVAVGAGLGAVASGFALWPPLLLAGLFVLGTATGFWDVAVSVHAAALERRLGRALMPRFFAGFSVGTVAGACLGALMTMLSVPVSLHIGAVALLVAPVTPAAVRHFLPRPAPTAPSSRGKARGPGAHAWRHPGTVRLGLVALAFALAEGAGSNWISLAVIDRHHTTAAVGTLAYAAFLTAVTLGRWLGPLIVDRVGRPGALRSAACAACLGVTLFAAGPRLWTGFAGALLWGAGAALGFPLSLSAGSDDPAHAAARVGVITSIGYAGFVCGPPLIGALADRTGLAPALLVIAAVMATPLVLAGAARAAPRATRGETADTPAATTT